MKAPPGARAIFFFPPRDRQRAFLGGDPQYDHDHQGKEEVGSQKEMPHIAEKMVGEEGIEQASQEGGEIRIP
jgi:hypothetical protein